MAFAIKSGGDCMYITFLEENPVTSPEPNTPNRESRPDRTEDGMQM